MAPKQGEIVSNAWLSTAGFLADLGLTLLLVYFLTPWAARLGLLDHPGERKAHDRATPVSGGLAMLLAILIIFALLFGITGPATRGFGLAALIVTAQGVADDRWNLSWYLRLLIQIIAALVMIYVGGIRIEYLGDIIGFGPVELGWFSVPFTVFATVGAINAVNMIDGSDGLAGVLALGALGMLGAAALYADNANVYTRIPALMGAVAGFLLYNLRLPGQDRARVFMGNAGSAFLGLTIACFSIRLTQDPAHPVGPILVLWLIPVAVMDCLVLIVRRLRHLRSPFAADCNHIHHLMHEAGFGPNRIAFTLLAFSLATGFLAGLILRVHLPQAILAGSFALLCLVYFWLTSRRARAVAFFRWLRHWPAAVPVLETQGQEAASE